MHLDNTLTPPRCVSQRLVRPHGMFSASGGISTGSFASLNLSYHVGDQENQVRANRGKVTAALGLGRLVSAHQVHQDRVLLVDQAHAQIEEHVGFDALITAQPGIGLLIQQADCQAVLLAARSQAVVAAVHCGWRGSVCGILGKTITRMGEAFGIDPAELDAVISPSLGPCCAEFIHYQRELPEWMHAFQVRPFFFDFWAISRWQLQQAGVLPDRIEVAGLCTCCDRRFFSYRRAVKTSGGVTGRNGSVIGLPCPQGSAGVDALRR